MTTEPLETFEPEDIEKNKTMAGLAYFLFFLPLVVCPDSRFGKYHANQGLILFLFYVIGAFALTIIPIIGWFLLPFFALFALILAIIGLLNGLNGRAKELPLIGKYRLIK